MATGEEGPEYEFDLADKPEYEFDPADKPVDPKAAKRRADLLAIAKAGRRAPIDETARITRGMVQRSAALEKSIEAVEGREVELEQQVTMLTEALRLAQIQREGAGQVADEKAQTLSEQTRLATKMTINAVTASSSEQAARDELRRVQQELALAEEEKKELETAFAAAAGQLAGIRESVEGTLGTAEILDPTFEFKSKAGKKISSEEAKKLELGEWLAQVAQHARKVTSAARAQVALRDVEIATATARANANERNVQEIKTQREEKDEVIAELRQQILALGTAKGTLEAKVSEVKSADEAVRSALEEKRKENAALQQELADLRAQKVVTAATPDAKAAEAVAQLQTSYNEENKRLKAQEAKHQADLEKLAAALAERELSASLAQVHQKQAEEELAEEKKRRAAPLSVGAGAPPPPPPGGDSPPSYGSLFWGKVKKEEKPTAQPPPEAFAYARSRLIPIDVKIEGPNPVLPSMPRLEPAAAMAVSTEPPRVAPRVVKAERPAVAAGSPPDEPNPGGGGGAAAMAVDWQGPKANMKDIKIIPRNVLNVAATFDLVNAAGGEFDLGVPSRPVYIEDLLDFDAMSEDPAWSLAIIELMQHYDERTRHTSSLYDPTISLSEQLEVIYKDAQDGSTELLFVLELLQVFNLAKDQKSGFRDARIGKYINYYVRAPLAQLGGNQHLSSHVSRITGYVGKYLRRVYDAAKNSQDPSNLFWWTSSNLASDIERSYADLGREVMSQHNDALAVMYVQNSFTFAAISTAVLNNPAALYVFKDLCGVLWNVNSFRANFNTLLGLPGGALLFDYFMESTQSPIFMEHIWHSERRTAIYQVILRALGGNAGGMAAIQSQVKHEIDTYSAPLWIEGPRALARQ